MRRVLPLILTLAALVVSLPAWAAAEEEGKGAGSCKVSQQIEAPLLLPEPKEVGFCNTQGFPDCATFDGTPCGPYNPPNQRCVANAAYCEWGICHCNGTQYNCYW